MELPFLLASDINGNIFELPPYRMTGMSLDTPVLPDAEALIELPYGSNLYMLPGRIPVGYDPEKKSFVEIQEYRGNPVFPVAAFMAPAYMQVLRTAYRTPESAPPLPLFAYTACGWKEEHFYSCGIRIDRDIRQDLALFDLDDIRKRAMKLRRRYSHNRLILHLIDNCVLRYGCPAARNFVLSRWECPAPTSPYCNARCIGCISKQPCESGMCASQDRIGFVPDVTDIVELAMHHLNAAPLPVISFGQGCEGEPLLTGDVIEGSIREIRKKTGCGIININTNGSRPDVVERLLNAGLDSIRVSLSSAQDEFYRRYHRPQGYSFGDVIESLRLVRKFGKWVSVNYFIFPGFTDHVSEITALEKLVNDVPINMIQTRNLNIDPDIYMGETGCRELGHESIGLLPWITHIKTTFPWIKFGYFNPPREEMKTIHFR